MLKSGGGEMEIAMQECWAELTEWEGGLDFSVSSSTTTTPTSTHDDMACEWDDWALDVDWKAFAGEDDFGGLIESMIDQDCDGPQIQEEPCNSVSTSTTTTTSTMATAISEETSDEDFKGLRVVHLLIAAAEALAGANKSGDLARVILVRLKELVSPTTGTNMERIAACFADALQGLVEGTGLHNKQALVHYHRDIQQHHPSHVLAAFQLLQDMSPYVKFGHFTANQAILEAVAHERRVHIVDYDIMEGIQWASLMQALVSRKDGPPTAHLRITALTRGGGAGRRSIGTIQETGRRLVAFAASIGQPFSFHQCRLDPEENFRPSALKLVKGDALVINCMLHLPHFTYRSPGSVLSFLSGAAALGPKLITLVEEEAGPTGGDGFVGRFMDSLHHYSALYDSLEAGFPMQGRARALVEKVFLGPRIAGSVAKSYCAHKGEESWGEWIGAAGFEPVAISFFNHCQAKLLLGLFNDGYRVEEVAANRIVLGWKSRRILSASIWAPPPPPPQNSPLNSHFPS